MRIARLQEVGIVSEATPGTMRRQVTIITPGWGSSGYYSEEMIREFGPRAVPVGTHMYLNHPTPREEAERPERDLRDLVARVASTPTISESGHLVADADIFPMWAPAIDALAEDIGLSIRLPGEGEHGEAEGRSGLLITALYEGGSVDFVTRAGRGGKVGTLIEAARKIVRTEEARNAGHWFESRIHQDFTATADRLFGEGYLTREERIALSNAIGDALTAFNASVEANVPGLYSRDPFADPEETATTATETKGDPVAEPDARITALEAQVRRLAEDLEESRRIAAEERTKRERAEDALQRVGAARVVEEAIAEVEGLPDRARTRVVAEAMRGNLPTTEDGRLDQETLKERAVRAARAELQYLSDSGAGGGIPSGVGSTAAVESAVRAGGAGATANATEHQRLVESFMGLGMDEATAKLAAGGR